VEHVIATIPVKIHTHQRHSPVAYIAAHFIFLAQSSYFHVLQTYSKDYPAYFRAKALYYRFATAWRTEPKHMAWMFLLRAFMTDPAQIPFGLRVIKLGITRAAARATFGNC
jgi:hypothetical protein